VAAPEDRRLTDPKLARLFFEARAMDLLGFRPEVASCAACGGELDDRTWFSVSAGGAVCGGTEATRCTWSSIPPTA
jgi:recombinational DNA repair protein (RecF pathway)